jgi:hypothetical protein
MRRQLCFEHGVVDRFHQFAGHLVRARPSARRRPSGPAHDLGHAPGGAGGPTTNDPVGLLLVRRQLHGSVELAGPGLDAVLFRLGDGRRAERPSRRLGRALLGVHCGLQLADPDVASDAPSLLGLGRGRSHRTEGRPVGEFRVVGSPDAFTRHVGQRSHHGGCRTLVHVRLIAWRQCAGRSGRLPLARPRNCR